MSANLDQNVIDAINAKAKEMDSSAILSHNGTISMYANLTNEFARGATQRGVDLDNNLLESLATIHVYLLYNILITIGEEQFKQNMPIIMRDIWNTLISGNNFDVYIQTLPIEIH